VTVQTIRLGKHIDTRGGLIVGQHPDQLSFTPTRFFVISNVPVDELRGQHAHRSNKQILVCLAGSLTAKFHDGKEWSEFNLLPNGEGVTVPAMHFGELSKFSRGTILLVLASESYNADEYINDFEEFLAELETRRLDRQERH
jgi:dTDP-4-dehydrorhamnose 3,5-epimerase-like enzyme